MDQPKDLIDVNEAARIIGVTVGRVRQLLIAEELDGCKLNARAWLVKRSDAERFAKQPRSTGRPRTGTTA